LDFKFNEHTSVSPDALGRLNDLDLMQVLRDEMLTDESIARHPAGRHRWESRGVKPPYFIRDVEGRPCSFGHLEITYEVRERHYFGYLSEVDDVLFLHDEAQKKATLLLPAESLTFNYKDRFAEFSRVQDLPVRPRLTFSAVVTPPPDSFRLGVGSIRQLPRTS
jgi:hypothetical protein